jgi:hypothetical protein
MKTAAELKQAAKPMFSAVVARLSREHSRTEARDTIRAVLDENATAGNDRRFFANYLMSQLGYGGGF